MKIRGSAVGQVNYILRESGIFQPGQSKHEAKQEAREQGAQDWHEVGKNLGVYSYSTLNAYRTAMVEAFRYAKEQFGIKQITDIKQEHLQAYLQQKIKEGLSKNTLKQYTAAWEKLEVALNHFAEKVELDKQYSFDFSQIREQIHEIKQDLQSRAYENPQALINALQNPKHQIVAQLQYTAGLRVSEASRISGKQLTRTEKGYELTIKGKGGKIREVQISKELGDRLKNSMQNGKFTVNYKEYAKDLKEAAARTGQEWHGTHGLRHNYAQESYIKHSLTDPAHAKEEVSKELGHNRPYITNTYLR